MTAGRMARREGAERGFAARQRAGAGSRQRKLAQTVRQSLRRILLAAAWEAPGAASAVAPGRVEAQAG
jgi:hypothetical protein